MLTVKLHTDPEKLGLRLNGHAGAGKWGEDIVCAAASILTYTAAASAGQLYRAGKMKTAPRIRLLPGDGLVETENSPAAAELMQTVCTGYRLLALRYPENIQFIKE